MLTPAITGGTRAEATDIRILVSVLLLAPPAFFMGMMFPLGLNIWRRPHSELLPFFWGANGIMSVFASVLGMGLSMEFGIADTYAVGIFAYGLCAVMAVELVATTIRHGGADGAGRDAPANRDAASSPARRVTQRRLPRAVSRSRRSRSATAGAK